MTAIVSSTRSTLRKPSGAKLSQAQKPDDDLEELKDAIRAMAADKKLASERDLAETLGVKRHQLRRALLALRANGELEPARAKRQSLVSHDGESLVRATNPMEVIEMRIAIEPFLARLAAVRASPQEMARIEQAATTASDVDSGAWDVAFHKLIAAASGNKLAASLYSLLRQVSSDARVRLGSSNRPATPQRIATRDTEHRAIAQAIVRRDPDGADRAMRAHLASVQKRVMEQLNPGAIPHP
ncbi:MAG TPA: FCD domain-containing protein [Beijerinckiaceae bacterium]|nr:FCD domain-containing protein [Beijerinckiaceae bacterium]